MICVLGFLVGFSRGAIGNLAIAALIFFALKFSLKPTLTLFVKYVVYGSIMLLASVVFIIAALQTEKVGSMLEERAKLVQSYDTGSGGRFDIQKKTLVQGLSDPLGLGPGEEVLEFGIEPHNVYLYILSENGWLGLIGFSAFILAGIRIGITCLNRCRDISDEFLIIFTVTLATALQSLLIDSIHWRHLFVLNGVLWGFSLNALRSVALQTGYQKDSDPLMTNRNPA
jgi:O-antigen ligase